MPDKLYRSHSIDFSDEGSSGSFTLWQDAPVSPFNVGDTFYPVGSFFPLTVDKVSIRDNVIGEQFGKTIRQWEITIEGSDSSKKEQSTHVRYNFTISHDEVSGSMEVSNSGDAPAISLRIGDTFNVPGIGEVTCVKVSGNDTYDDDVHSWSVTYEGSDHPDDYSETSETKYSFSIDENGRSGSMSVYVSGDNPDIDLDVGSEFSLPGIGKVKCTKISGSDDGSHVWNITYEGSNEPSDEQDDSLPQIKYSFSIDEDGHSGSMTAVNEGNAPALNIMVGDSFSIPGIGKVTCTKVSGNDEYTDSNTHRWSVTYEGSIDEASDDELPDDYDPNSKFSFSLDSNSKSGSVEVTSASDTLTFAHNVGDKISLPGIGEVTCSKVSGSDSYSDNGKRKWTVLYECSDSSPDESNVKYSLNIENNSEGVTTYSGSKEFSCSGASPKIDISIGGSFSLPIVGKLTCTKIHSSNSDNNSWSVIIEGSRTGSKSDDDDDSTALPDDEVSISYEINGSTVRSVAGEFIALRRSKNPITKKSFTVYSESDEIIAIPGSTYQDGIVTSVNIIKETIKNNGVVTGSYYKHSIEVEA